MRGEKSILSSTMQEKLWKLRLSRGRVVGADGSLEFWRMWWDSGAEGSFTIATAEEELGNPLTTWLGLWVWAHTPPRKSSAECVSVHSCVSVMVCHWTHSLAGWPGGIFSLLYLVNCLTSWYKNWPALTSIDAQRLEIWLVDVPSQKRGKAGESID